MSAAKSDNETQFVEVSKVELARILYPDIKPTGYFLGIVKSEPERYTAYGESFFATSLTQINYSVFTLKDKSKIDTTQN